MCPGAAGGDKVRQPVAGCEDSSLDPYYQLTAWEASASSLQVPGLRAAGQAGADERRLWGKACLWGYEGRKERMGGKLPGLAGLAVGR